ncbi:hypothetical protein D3C85_1142590 [compost metagenome]
MNEVIKNNLSIIHQRIAHACLKAGRDPATVQLLLATKTVPSEKIKQNERIIHGNEWRPGDSYY